MSSDDVMTEATVVSIARSKVQENGEHLWLVRYSYRDGSGRQHTGESGLLSFDEAHGWQPGDIGGVRYHADDPARSAWTGSLLPSSAGDS
jgi:hypothetical protein